jgi:hypothetical protein
MSVVDPLNPGAGCLNRFFFAVIGNALVSPFEIGQQRRGSQHE